MPCFGLVPAHVQDHARRAAAAALPHPLADRSDSRMVATHIDLPQSLQFLLERPAGRRAGQHVGAGVVDPNVDAAAPVPGLSTSGSCWPDPPDRPARPSLGGRQSRIAAATCLRGLPVDAGVDHDIGPGRRQFQGDGPADAGLDEPVTTAVCPDRSPGDDDNVRGVGDMATGSGGADSGAYSTGPAQGVEGRDRGRYVKSAGHVTR